MIELGMSHDEIGRLSYPQYLNVASQGKPPTPGRRRFASTDEARAYRESLKHVK